MPEADRYSTRFGGSSPVIDFHCHCADPLVYDWGRPHSVSSGFGSRSLPPDDTTKHSYRAMRDAATQIDDMDARGVDVNMLSASIIAQNTDWAPPHEAAAMDRHANEYIADWVRDRPSRFIGSFTLPLQDTDLALRELAHAVDDLGMRVATVSSNAAGGVYLGDRRFWPVWEELELRRVTVFMHPHGGRDERLQAFWLWNSVGQSIEETMFMTSMIYEGTLDRFPRLKIVLAHGGGFLPHYPGRVDRNATAHPESVVNIAGRPSDYFRRFHYDSCTYSTAVLSALVTVVGADRVVLGGDYPIGEADPVGAVRSAAGLSPDDVNMILSGNAARLLEIEAGG